MFDIVHDEWEALVPFSESCRYTMGDTIILRGSKNDKIFHLVSGTCAVTTASDSNTNNTISVRQAEYLSDSAITEDEEKQIVSGKDPMGMAASALYISSMETGENITQKKIAIAAGVTEVTIRNRCKEILTSFKLKIALRPTLAKK